MILTHPASSHLPSLDDSIMLNPHFLWFKIQNINKSLNHITSSPFTPVPLLDDRQHLQNCGRDSGPWASPRKGKTHLENHREKDRKLWKTILKICFGLGTVVKSKNLLSFWSLPYPMGTDKQAWLTMVTSHSQVGIGSSIIWFLKKNMNHNWLVV